MAVEAPGDDSKLGVQLDEWVPQPGHLHFGASHEVPNPAPLLRPGRVCVSILCGRTSVQLCQGLCVGRGDPNSGSGSHLCLNMSSSLRRTQSQESCGSPALMVTVDIAMGTWQMGCNCGPAGCGPGRAWQLPSAACCPLLAKPGKAGGCCGDWPGEGVTSVRAVKSFFLNLFYFY